jgi:hypothetical protein
MDQVVRRSSCACGRVQCEGVGKPIFSGVCYCADCQRGGRRIETLPHAPAVLDADGGAAYLTYRDDRFRRTSGADLLKSQKLGERAPTQRFVASCCNSAMYLKFAPGHWISAYRTRFEGELPPIEARSQTKHRVASTPLPNDAPSYRGFPPKLMGRLLGSRLAMLFGR